MPDSYPPVEPPGICLGQQFGSATMVLLLLLLSHFSRVRPYATLCTIAHQAPLSMGVSRQEYWSGLPCLPPGDLPEPGIEPGSPALQADVFYH